MSSLTNAFGNTTHYSYDINNGQLENTQNANGNPVSFVDPFGLSADRESNDNIIASLKEIYDVSK